MDERLRRAFDAVRADADLKNKTLDALERRRTRFAPRRRPMAAAFAALALVILTAVGGYMTKPDSSQYIYIDLSEADAVVVYDQEPVWSGAAGLFQGAAEVVGNVVEYFR